MRVSVVQYKSFKGDIQANILEHKKFILSAAQNDVDIIIFPELSITGYEPTLANHLAIDQKDPLLDSFQDLALDHQITIGVGIPIQNQPRPKISMVLFDPAHPKQIYAKKYIHADEEPFFVNGRNTTTTLNRYPNIALAICYEISVPQHALDASRTGANIYLASIAKTVKGVEAAHQRLSEIARTYQMTVMLSNCVGMADGAECGGRSAVWDNTGQRLFEMDETSEGLLIFDTITEEISVDYE